MVGQERRMANAIKMLQDDHNSVRVLMNQLPTIQNGASDEEEKAALAIISTLKTHTVLEEELVYPVLAETQPDLVKHAQEEHGEFKQMLAEIEERPAGPELRDVVTRLQTVVEGHIAEEEETLFPLLTEVLGIEGLEDLGLQMLTRQQELLQTHDETTGAAMAGRPKAIFPKI